MSRSQKEELHDLLSRFENLDPSWREYFVVLLHDYGYLERIFAELREKFEELDDEATVLQKEIEGLEVTNARLEAKIDWYQEKYSAPYVRIAHKQGNDRAKRKTRIEELRAMGKGFKEIARTVNDEFCVPGCNLKPLTEDGARMAFKRSRK